MQLSLVTARDESHAAFRDLKHSFARDAQRFPAHSVGWQSGGGHFDVHWHPSQRLWGLFLSQPPISEHRPRCWICFGIDNPGDHSGLQITVEMNPPHEGIDRRVGGAFLRGQDGGYYLGHTGRVGGGRKGIGMRAFLDFYRGIDPIFVPERRAKLFVFGPSASESFIATLSNYVHQVARFKMLVSSP